MPAKSQLKAAIRANDHAGVKAAVAEDPDVIHMVTAVGPWLNMAAKSSTVEIMQLLVELGADPNAKDPDSRGNALHRAASQGDLEKVQCMRQAGAALDTSEAKVNPLFAAIYAKSPEVTAFLID